VDKDFAPTHFDTDLQDEPAETGVSTGRFQAWLQRLGIVTDGGLRDRQTRLLNRQGLLARGERLVSAPASTAALVLFDFSDLLELRGLYDRHATLAALSMLVDRLERLAGRRGLAARTGPAQFGVLLPDSTRDHAIDAVHRVFGNPCRLELELGREELVLLPNTTVDVCAKAPGSLEELYTRLSIVLARRRDHEERRRRTVRRRRERVRQGATRG